jgi:predicted alpha/beta-fold hydrolase
LAAACARHEAQVYDGGHGVRLAGVLSRPREGGDDGRLAVLLHGWEGSQSSSYMQLGAARLLQAGCAVLRLNFRDHGDTHHLNVDLFHSNRLGEVVQAIADACQRHRVHELLLAGHSLGGNFALRVAAAAPAAGLPLARVAAVCPVVDPAATLLAMERGWRLYPRYFARQWRTSLKRKRTLFPQQHAYDDAILGLDLRHLTEWLVLHHTDFASLHAYFDGYTLSDGRLAELTVPARVLTSADDPVIPVAAFDRLALPDSATLEVARWGGHCGFIENARLDGYAERWLGRVLLGETSAGTGKLAASSAD